MRLVVTANTSWNILNFRRGLMEALVADGHHVTVLAPPDTSVDGLREMGCEHVALAMDQKGLSPLGGLSLLRAFRRHFRELSPDAVLSFTIKNNVFGSLAARARGVAFLPNVTGLGTAFLSGKALLAVARGLYRTSFAGLPVVFFQNADDRELFVRLKLVRAEQARLLPGSGVDLARFAPRALPDTPPLRFLMISRPLRDKGVVEYAEAAATVRKRHPDARFALLGPTAYDNRSAVAPETLRAWAEAGTMEHLGETADVRPFIAASHCVVLPSYREGAPRSLIEAAAMGRAVVTSDVPGCRTVVENEVSGFLCEARSTASLADALLAFAELSGAERAAMGRAGRQKMEREFDEALVVRAYREALSEIAPPSGPPSGPRSGKATLHKPPLPG